MMVEEENYRTGQFSTHGRNVGVLQVQRTSQGTWRIVAEIEIEVKLPDGRTVIAKERAMLMGKAEFKKQRRRV